MRLRDFIVQSCAELKFPDLYNVAQNKLIKPQATNMKILPLKSPHRAECEYVLFITVTLGLDSALRGAENATYFRLISSTKTLLL